MIIRETSEKLLDKLRTPNYRRTPDFGMDSVSEKIIDIITNECKSTILTNYNIDDNFGARKYGSDIIKGNLHQIIRQLILNGGTIPKEVMNKIMFSEGRIIGVDSDIELYKGIREAEDGSMERTATVSNPLIDLHQLDGETLSLINKEIYDRFARQFVLQNSEQLPNVSKFSIFKEKILHGRENREFIAKKFESILKNKTGYNDEIIKSTVQYHLDYMYDNKFKNNILETMNTGTGLVPLDSKGKKLPFALLQEAVSAESQDLGSIIPNINQIREDIEQAYADVETQLMAYSTDLTQLNAYQIESKIKQVGRTSLKNSEMIKYMNRTGYRNVDVGISNNSVKMVQFQNVPKCMLRISTDIQKLVQNADNMDREEYLKRAVQLQYRFIRIHPFSDSNGRTSRALLNMMTIPKGFLIEVPKEKKGAFVQSQRDTNEQLDSQGYYEALNGNLDELDNIEARNIESLPEYKFIAENCIVEIESQDNNQNIQKQRENELEQPYQEEEDIEQE